MHQKQNNEKVPTQDIGFSAALTEILQAIHSLNSQPIPITEALDRVLVADVVAPADIPPFDNAAMDGFAVRAEDLAGASPDLPAVLRVVGEIPAGRVAYTPLESKTAMRIMTGAPLPPGGDTVVPIELTAPAGKQVQVLKPVKLGANIRRAGEDIGRGQVVLYAGQVLRPADIGVLAAMGYSQVDVVRRPRVAVLTTGDELVPIDAEVTPGKIRNANEYTAIAMIKRYGGRPIPLGIARDTRESLAAKIKQALDQKIDLIVTSAGVSVGDYDVVKQALAVEANMRFWRVFMKPGKPLGFGHIQGVPVLALPGNPAAFAISFELFVRPTLRLMQGHTLLEKPAIQATVDEDVRSNPRRHFLRARVRREDDGYRVTTRDGDINRQGSAMLSSMLWANGLLVVPEDVTFVPAGSQVQVLMLDWPEVVF